jgi:16S rRNA (guanine966-N2)-methyltransferase
MRIIAGEWRGRSLIAPPKASLSTRPTADRVRENLFNLLSSRVERWPDQRVVDLCAGTGALGLEALSRGAAHCVFVERDPAACRLIRDNLTKLGASDRAHIVQADVLALPRATDAATLLFLDPPYADAREADVLGSAAAQGWLAPSALVGVETPRGRVINALGFEPLLSRDYGSTRLTLLRWQ